MIKLHEKEIRLYIKLLRYVYIISITERMSMYQRK